MGRERRESLARIWTSNGVERVSDAPVKLAVLRLSSVAGRACLYRPVSSSWRPFKASRRYYPTLLVPNTRYILACPIERGAPIGPNAAAIPGIST
jgi:hypothetical protein